MANALPEEYEQHFYNQEDTDDEDAGTSKQNGAVYQKCDRYGFMGGDQYTDPSKYVYCSIVVLISWNFSWNAFIVFQG